MYKHLAFCLVCLIGLTANAQTINLRGVVSNSAGKPVANAILVIAKQGLKDTTGTDGSYSITKSTAVVTPMLALQNKTISIDKGFLEFSLPEPSPVKVAVFDLQGNLLKKEYVQTVPAGFYRFNIEENIHTANLLVIKASIGRDEFTFRRLPLNSGKYMVNPAAEGFISVNGKLAKITAINDTLKITAANFASKSVPLTSYDQQLNITLDSVSNAPAGSIGCGKALGSLKTGTYTITSAGLNREYIIDIPKNYDPNKPLRLIFAMHCMCGSMWSVQSENFYELKRCADSANVQCIFVAPSVYNGGNYNQSNWGCPVWDQGAKDHTFFDDMLTLFKGELCVDTTRVFSVGFSYGAMFTNSLAQNHQNVLRAVVCYETSLGGGIYVPKNTGLPIAWMGTVGLSDTRCPPADGRACRDIILKNNALNGVVTTEKATETTSGSKTHVIYDYKGVDPRYPVKWCTFDGDHQWSPVDGTSSGYDPNKTWTPEVAWHFISQF